ncbi:hypothetical protein BS78_03G061400 [Paspalum vaginatum]|nr:hypothetical protein BS78_03G061400 [Paspalum vaginatum]
MAAAGTATAVSMKLFVDTKTQRVVVAVASTEVLRSLLASPHEPLHFEAATVHGCIGNLYDSLDILDAAASSRQGAGCGGYVTEARGASCPSCGGEMAMEVPRGSPGSGSSTGGAYTGGGGAADGSTQGAAGGTCINHGAALREETVRVGFTQVSPSLVHHSLV